MGFWSSARQVTKLVAIAAFAVTCLACSNTHVPVMLKRPQVSQPLVTKLYHADRRFTENEQSYILSAVDNINVQSSGVINVDVVFDLDWDVTAPTTRSHDDLIVKMLHDSTAVTKQDKDLPDGNVVLGWCDVKWTDPTYPTRVYIVADRINTSGKFSHVVMHEMLHSLRLQHIRGEKVSILYWQTLGDFPPICLSYFDAEELCRVYHCKLEEISYCE